MACKPFLALVLLVLVSSSFAVTPQSCAARSYAAACSSCPFDSQGKMDQTCYQVQQASGTACVSSNYPVAAAEYAAGKCPAIDDCAQTLQTCKAATSSGNDKEDCQGDIARQCFVDADTCVMHAAMGCGEQVSCTPTFLLFGVVGAALAFAQGRR